MKQDIIKQFSLPTYIKGKTFAEASKLIEKKFIGREDKISLDTKQAILMRLAQAQEALKQEGTATNTFSGGGETSSGATPAPSELGEFSPEVAIGALDTAAGFGSQIFGKSDVDTSGNTKIHQDSVSVGGSAASGAFKGLKTGAAAGAMFGAPGAIIGAGIGTAVGAISGFIGGKKNKTAAIEAQTNGDYIANNKYNNDFAAGGTMPMGGNCGGPGQPPCVEAKLDSTDLQNIRQNVGFDTSTAKRLLYKEVSAPQDTTALDFGKYGKVGYFDSMKTPTGKYEVSNTANNPNNRATMGHLVKYLKDINPKKDINFNFKSKNSFSTGGPMGGCGGPGEPPCEEVGQGDMGYIQSDPYGPLTASRAGFGVQNINKPSISTNEAPIIPKIKNGKKPEKRPMQNKIGTVNSKGISSYGKLIPEERALIDKPLHPIIAAKTKKSVLDYLRYAPALTNLGQLLGNKKDRYESLGRLDKRYKPNLVDEMGLQNTINNQYGNIYEAINNASNGSLGASRSNMLAAYLGKQSALSKAYLGATNINNSEKSKQQVFDLGVDKVNLQQANLENEINAKNLGAFKSNQSNLLAQLGENLGGIGKEEFYKKQAKVLFGYDWNGKFFVNSAGQKLTEKEMATKIKDSKTKD